MGVDIHMYLVYKPTNEIIIKDRDLFIGRCTWWFDEICGRGYFYKDFPNAIGHVEDMPAAIAKEYEEYGGYGLRTIPLDELAEWHDAFQPWRDAGWVPKYESWEMDNRKLNMRVYEPGFYDRNIEKEEEHNHTFREYEVYNPFSNILANIMNKAVDIFDSNYEIVYWFDC